MTTDLTSALESSIHALEGGGKFVPTFYLPTATQLAAVHAQLERVIRSQRRFRGVSVLPMPEVP